MATLTNSLCRGDGNKISLQVIGSDNATLSSAINIATSNDYGEFVSIGNNLSGKRIFIDGGKDVDLFGSFGVNIGTLGGENIAIGAESDTSNSYTYIYGGNNGVALIPNNFGLIQLIGQVTTKPVNSSVATGAFVTSLTAGTSVQNTSGNNLLCNICVNITAATGATITLGVGSETAPTDNTVVSTFTTAAVLVTNFSAMVPNQYYLVINTTGTITIGSITVQSCPM